MILAILLNIMNLLTYLYMIYMFFSVKIWRDTYENSMQTVNKERWGKVEAINTKRRLD